MERDLPSGVVTFMFTDIEGSTSLVETLGRNYDPLLEQHRSFIREAVAAHGGHEIRTEGDAFFIVFGSASAAVQAALAAQRTLCGHGWPPEAQIRVRIGLHTGEARLAAGDYTGVAVHRAARIAAAAHGGQVVLSDATRALVTDELSGGAGLKDLGEHDLRGLERTERLWQLTHPDLAADFPPPRSEAVPEPAARDGGDFVGRTTELRRLTELLAEVQEARGRLALVAGEAGIGKTRLTEELCDVAVAAGARILTGACWEGDGAPPYWAWLQVIRSLPGGGDGGLNLGQILGLGDIAGDDLERARFLLFDAVAARLRAAAGSAPLVVVLDDMHWAEPSSVDLLRFAARELRRSAVMLVATYRDDEMDPELVRTLARDGEIISLHGLGAHDVAALMQRTVGASVGDAMLSTVAGQTGGNPFFVHEVARMIGSQAAGMHFRPRAIQVPAGVREVILRRVERVSDACRAMLEAAAVLGASFDPAVVAQLIARGAEEMSPLLDEAASAGILLLDPVRFVHALTRDALISALPSADRVSLHAAAADVLARIPGTSAAEVAAHAVGAGRADAPELAAAAGEEAMTGLAYAEAAEHFERALEAAGAGAPLEVRVPILRRLLVARIAAGHPARARECARELAAAARSLEDPELLAEAALAPGGGVGGFEIPMLDAEQISMLQEAVSALGEAETPTLARVLARLSVATSYEESIESRREHCERAVRIAEAAGDAEALAAALLSTCDAIAGPDHIDERLANASRVLELRRESKVGPATELLARRFRVVALAERGDTVELDREIEAFARVAESLRQPAYTWYVPLFRGLRAQMRGDFDEAARCTQEVAEIGGRAESINSTMLTAAQRLAIAYFTGETAAVFDEMFELFDSVSAWSEPGLRNIFFAYGRIWTGMQNGDLSEARREFDAVPTSAILALPRDSEWLDYVSLISEGMAILGDTARAQVLYDLISPYGDVFVIDGIAAGTHGPVCRFLGMLADALGRNDDAEAHLRRAIEVCEAAGSPPLAARARFELGMVQLRAGRGPEELRRAIEDCRGLGMGFWAGFGELALASAGAEVAARPAPAPAGNVFRREGELFTLTYAGETVRAKDSKGLRDIAKLLANPGRELHAMELYAGPGAVGTTGELDSVEGAAGPAIDEKARAAYKARIAELEEDIAEAEADNDPGRLAKATAERDTILAELSAALGLGGRARAVGDPAERARKAVTQRIKDALGRLGRDHAALARHLERSVRTGTFCSYEPEQPVDWVL